MKITKILPLALALTLAVPAFADVVEGATSAKSDLLITVPKFINITRNETSMVEEANAGFDADYANLTLNKSLVAAFHVVTNNPDEKVQLTATTKADGAQVNALYKNSDGDLNIVFTNIGTGTRAATQTAVTNVMTGADPAINVNAIGFKINHAATAVSGTGASTPGTTINTDNVEYTLVNGEYDFSYTVLQSALANTFSTHDTDGTYQATLTLSQVQP